MLNLINNLLGHIIDNLDSLLIILANNLEIVKYNKIAKKYFSLNCSASNPDLLNECCKIIHISKDELKLCLESNKQIHKLITLNHKLILELIIKRIFFNNVSYLIIQGFNVTENVLSRNHVKDLYSYLETIVDTVPHTIFWKDRNSTFMGCNKLFAKLAGLRFTNEIIGKTDFDLPWNKEQSQQYRA
ncbi:MAG: hypothetical protein REH83_06710 [Rickettsiella sp.]|nr:hypothetical protein [Rickettsiella sp.]